jgi:hypothetical protein
VIEQERNYKRYINDHERQNISFADDHSLKRREIFDRSKQQDAEDMRLKIQAYERDLKEKKRAKSEFRRQYCKWQEDIESSRKRNVQNER